jgi:hypothetical protein
MWRMMAAAAVMALMMLGAAITKPHFLRLNHQPAALG